MLPDFLEDTAKNLANRILPPIQRYFTYFFIIVGILWLGGANYYYFAEDCPKFQGALITGLVFFALASLTALWEYFKMRKKTVKPNSNELIVKALPIALPLIYNVFKRVILRPKMLKTLVAIGAVGTGLYYSLQARKNKSDL